MNKKVTAAVCIVGICVLGIAGSLAAAMLHKEEEITYRETAVEYGPLTVGITETGSTEVGTAVQSLDVDISAYTDESSSSFQFGGQGGTIGGMSAGMGMMLQSGAGSSASSADSRALQVETLYVSVGRQVSKGDLLFGLSPESVDEIRAELSDDVTEAQLALQKTETAQKSTLLSATHTYETNTTYGEAAQLEYDETVSEAQEQYGTAAEKLQDAQEKLSELQEEMEALSAKAAQDAHLYDEAAYLVKYIDREADPYGYTKALELSAGAQSTAEASADEKEELQEEIDNRQKEIASLTLTLTEAEQNQKLAQIEARALYDTRLLNYSNAAELYSVETSLAQEQKTAAQEAYETACRKLEKFDDSIQNYAVISAYDGVITQLDAAVGDSLSKGTQLLTLNNYEDITAVVTVSDDAIGQIAVGDKVNICLPAFEENSYTGVVQEIGDAQVGSADITYEVTVRLEGDAAGILTGMTAEVTFITRETEHVLYVSNRAVFRENAASYVLVRDENGRAVSREIRTGFSDGVNVEVISGLEEGDIVLIESKVSGS